VGTAPKTYARLVRFNALLAYLKHHTAADWADVAGRFGYYDQAHFARELRRFTGATPTEFLERRGPHGDTLTHAEPL
jgi:AraC-like DNA-binding protein